jgi:hypothetical protein
MMIREHLSRFEQRICQHGSTVDAAFYKSVRGRCGFGFVGTESRSFFDGKSDGRSEVWHCATRGCKVSAWIEMQSDAEMLTVVIKIRHFTAECISSFLLYFSSGMRDLSSPGGGNRVWKFKERDRGTRA